MVTQDQVHFFQENGFLAIEDYASGEEAEALRAEIQRIVREQNPQERKIFTTDQQTQMSQMVACTSFLAPKKCILYQKGTLEIKTLPGDDKCY